MCQIDYNYNKTQDKKSTTQLIYYVYKTKKH